MKFVSSTALLAVVSGALLSSGCAALLVGAGVAAGAGTVAYMAGELKATEEASLDQAWKAAGQAMADLEFNVTDQQKDALAGKLRARRADNTPVTIRLKRQTDDLTEIRIRVGTFGDESASRLILDKIKRRL